MFYGYHDVNASKLISVHVTIRGYARQEIPNPAKEGISRELLSQITFRNTAGHLLIHKHVGQRLVGKLLRYWPSTGRGVFTIELERNI